MLFRFAAQLGNATQHFGYPGGLVALTAVSGVRLVRSIALQQQELDRHPRHDPAQSLCALVSDRTTNADMEAKVPQLSCLLLAAGKAVHHAAQAAAPAQGEADFLERLASMHDHRQVPSMRELKLVREIEALLIPVQVWQVKIESDLAYGACRTLGQPLIQTIEVRWRVPGKIDRVQSVSGVNAGSTRAQVRDARPAFDIYGRYDHMLDTDVASAPDHLHPISVECLIVEVYMAVD